MKVRCAIACLPVAMLAADRRSIREAIVCVCVCYYVAQELTRECVVWMGSCGIGGCTE